MANKAVFIDRDHTLIEDPGYLADPSAVNLLPGVELALKSLSAAGYRIVVVTNQSGIARGLLTEEVLGKIHAELRRQLSDKGAHLDGIYYCPYHPEGTVEAYAMDSEMRKPKPGMLLKAAKELDIDLSTSWMVGDSPRDVEAGQRAGCRTIRVRVPTGPMPGLTADEDVQADFTVRNLVDAARVIMREQGRARHPRRGGTVEKVEARTSAGTPSGELPSLAEVAQQTQALAQAQAPDIDEMDDGEIRREILRHVRQLARAEAGEEFSFTKLIAGLVQMLAVLALIMVFVRMFGDHGDTVTWALIAVVLQVMALTFYVMHRHK